MRVEHERLVRLKGLWLLGVVLLAGALCILCMVYGRHIHLQDLDAIQAVARTIHMVGNGGAPEGVEARVDLPDSERARFHGDFRVLGLKRLGGALAELFSMRIWECMVECDSGNQYYVEVRAVDGEHGTWQVSVRPR